MDFYKCEELRATSYNYERARFSGKAESVEQAGAELCQAQAS